MEHVLRFAKMHAAGNDFVVVDLIQQDRVIDPQEVATWADRRFGIGCDQLLIVEPPEFESNDFTLTILNRDGSPAEQCGNGTACVSKFVRDQSLTNKTKLSFRTLGGTVKTRLQRVIDTTRESVEVEFSTPRFEPQFVPFLAEGGSTAHAINLEGVNGPLNLTPLSLGNPHAVLFVDDVKTAEIEAMGKSIQDHARFPESTNVEFVQVVNRKRMKLRIYERGAGETMACGSGACAAVVAARIHDLVEESVQVEQPGGTVQVTWKNEHAPVTIHVTAVRVFEGII